MLIHGNPGKWKPSMRSSSSLELSIVFHSSLFKLLANCKGSKRGIEIMLCNVQYKYDRRQQSRRIAAGRKGIVSFVPTFFKQSYWALPRN